MFLHNSILGRFWNTIEAMRPDCRFVYTTHDVDFAASRAENAIVWVRSYNPDTLEWDYDLLPSDSGLSEDLYMALVGSRRLCSSSKAIPPTRSTPSCIRWYSEIFG